MYLHGFHAIREALAGGPATELLIARDTARHRQLVRLARRRGVPVRQLAVAELTRLAGGTDHRGALLSGAFDRPTVGLKQALFGLPDRALAVALDGVLDPQNVGSIVRSAEQFGVAFVVARERRQAPVTAAAVAKASAGASSLVTTIIVANVVQALRNMQSAGFWVYGSAIGGDAVWRPVRHDRVVLVFGNEAKGLSTAVRSVCDVIVHIPTDGKVDSLNVAVAAGICLYEVRRQWASRA